MRCHLYCEGQNPAAVQKTYSRNNGIGEGLLYHKAFATRDASCTSPIPEP